MSSHQPIFLTIGGGLTIINEGVPFSTFLRLVALTADLIYLHTDIAPTSPSGVHACASHAQKQACHFIIYTKRYTLTDVDNQFPAITLWFEEHMAQLNGINLGEPKVRLLPERMVVWPIQRDEELQPFRETILANGFDIQMDGYLN